MSWEQLRAILVENAQRRTDEDAAPPESCPLCGDVLMIHPRTGERRCPTGDGYTWP